MTNLGPAPELTRGSGAARRISQAETTYSSYSAGEGFAEFGRHLMESPAYTLNAPLATGVVSAELSPSTTADRQA